jgi:hypothetical protein
MPDTAPLETRHADYIQVQLRALRMFIIGLQDQRLDELDSLLSVAESVTEQLRSQLPGESQTPIN